jgi:hypothetical protein
MNSLTFLLAQQEVDTDSLTGALIGAASAVMIPVLIILLVVVVGMWKVFEKAGKPGWASLIPIYSNVVLDEIIGKPVWWIVLWLIPCTAPFVAIVALLELAKVFGKSSAFAIGLILLPVVFVPILGFGDAQYRKPAPAMA